MSSSGMKRSTGEESSSISDSSSLFVRNADPDEGFPWPGEAAVRPEALPALAKNNAKNFMDHFFKGEGCVIVHCEVDRMEAQVISSSFLCTFSSP